MILMQKYIAVETAENHRIVGCGHIQLLYFIILIINNYPHPGNMPNVSGQIKFNYRRHLANAKVKKILFYYYGVGVGYVLNIQH